MGYFINNIAKETKTPSKVSLSSNTNYIEFSSMGNPANDVHVNISLTLKSAGYILESEIPLIFKNISGFKIVETKTGIEHQFKGTSVISEIDNSHYYLGPLGSMGGSLWYPDQVTETLRSCLINNRFIRSNFNVIVPPVETVNGIVNSSIIKITSRGAGADYAFKIVPDYPEFTDFITVTGNPNNTTTSDTISAGYNPTELQLELYTNTNVFLGEDDRPTVNNLGIPLTTLTKAYSNIPAWFNVNAIENNYYSNDFLNSASWCNTGTVRDFRFLAKRIIGSSKLFEIDVFYYSNVLYQITGYTRNLESSDLAEYVYSTSENNIVKPLTNQPELYHIKGQNQYFNFILSDPDHKKNLGSREYNIGLLYRLYTQSGRFTAEVKLHAMNRKLFNIVNTIKLDIEGAIGNYLNVGVVKVSLYRTFPNIAEPITISEPLVFNILPECLYKVNDFAFLNSLGGWSSFNFSGPEQTDFKASANTIYKTQTPAHTISSEIESIYSKDISEQFSVKTMPVTPIVSDWLKELSSSKAVYELSTKRYVIVDDLNIKPNSTDELFILEMKYRYSDSYNTLIK